MTDNNTSIQPLPVAADKEVALSDLLSTLLMKDVLHDLILKGTDGVEVGCHRVILAARSSVFQGMLFGKYSEASQKTVELGFKGEVLQAVVEYIYTDEPQILNAKKRKSSEKTDGFDMEQVKILLSLADASNFFHLPGLLEKAGDFLSKELNGHPTSTSFEVLEALMQTGPTVPGPLVEAAMNRVRQDRYLYMDNDFTNMSNSVLEAILHDQQTNQTESELFRILAEWTEENPEKRKPVTTYLAKHICLENISPLFLGTKVTDSGLVSTDQLLEAYKTHSLWPWKECYDTLRANTSVWGNRLSTISASKSGKNELDLLKVAPIKTGIYQWKVGILTDADEEDIDSCIWLGIASAGMPPDSSVPLGRAKGGWAVSDYGPAYAEGILVDERDNVSSGMEVTFTLNLLCNPTYENQNGRLTMATTDGSERRTLFTNLCDHLKKNPGGFVPAVSTCAPGRVRILEIKKLKD